MLTTGRDLISIGDLKTDEILSLLDEAAHFKAGTSDADLSGMLLGSCFYEPSTRTRLSFEAAMRRLGGDVIGFAEPSSSSSAKGESLYDAIKIVGQMVDVIVLRHPSEGAARVAAEATDKPVINAGDGAREHPTQTLLDLFSMQETQGRLEGLNIALTGDLRFGRTVHSLAKACARFGMRLFFIAPRNLELPEDVCDTLRQSGVCYSFHQTLTDLMPRIDILYLTRLQKERFSPGLEAPHQALISPELLEQAKPSLRILHPLPRVHELPRAIDATPHAYYFEAAQNGLYVRQALLNRILT